MFNERHELAQEFPEYRDAIHRLKMSDAHFAKLFTQYEEVDHRLHRIAEEIETPADEVTENLKKKRLALKDQLVAMLTHS